MQQYFEFSPEVEQAMQERKPVLALESTVITHGLPYPQNLETARELEDIARKNQVIPATIAIMHGQIKIGLTAEEMEELVNDKQAVKASKRDIPYIISAGLNAGTTVAATLYCADYAGIKVFATGGIGGVHRGNDHDVSADLIELARTPVAIVCAGAKAILDLPRTLEYLETHSIPIIGYRTNVLPAFYSASSDYKLPARVDGVTELVKLLRIHWQLGFNAGVLIANPVDAEDEIPAEAIEPVIASALEEAEKHNISGKDITPFLLDKVADATKGKSMQTNIKLIKNNVRLGAMIAHKLATT